ncbi:MAG: hypothetical protein ACJ77A_14710 [Actinomycetota bacterium]
MRAKKTTKTGNGRTSGDKPRRSEEFDRMEDLTRKLVRVPKREVQEAEAKREKRARRS